ncbi:hypothetical protein EVAR_80167_1 [Eumeta japonica]|uniref:Uncharacterized protein n=1 Tax=Eumeta variegata TaxID=151549 RepID=A0A4C1Y7D4_EUMVA|nr:hypothetical protein EVAR_80167_1 [Eumeta japonica]
MFAPPGPCAAVLDLFAFHERVFCAVIYLISSAYFALYISLSEVYEFLRYWEEKCYVLSPVSRTFHVGVKQNFILPREKTKVSLPTGDYVTLRRRECQQLGMPYFSF